MTQIEGSHGFLRRPSFGPPQHVIVGRFALVAAFNLVFLIVAAGAIWPRGAAQALPLAVFALLTGGALLGLWLRYPHERLGLCNVVTHFRSTLVALAAAPLAVPAAFHAQERLAWTALSIAVVALALDGFDGWLARRSGLSSDFGARFDVEVDAALALILALLVWQADKVGPWIMVLGLARYAFVAGVGLVTWLRAPLPPRLRRKVICVVQLGALIALLAPPVQPPFAQLLASVAALLLVWSFSMDIAWLWRRRNPS